MIRIKVAGIIILCVVIGLTIKKIGTASQTSNTNVDYNSSYNFVGSTWISRITGTSIYFQDNQTVVYHAFSNGVAGSIIDEVRRTSAYHFEPNSSTLTINDLDAIPNVVLTYSDDKSTGEKYLSTVLGDKTWMLSHNEDLINKLK